MRLDNPVWVADECSQIMFQDFLTKGFQKFGLFHPADFNMRA
jgi:hypothetical protein